MSICNEKARKTRHSASCCCLGSAVKLLIISARAMSCHPGFPHPLPLALLHPPPPRLVSISPLSSPAVDRIGVRSFLASGAGDSFDRAPDFHFSRLLSPVWLSRPHFNNVNMGPTQAGRNMVSGLLTHWNLAAHLRQTQTRAQP